MKYKVDDIVAIREELESLPGTQQRLGAYAEIARTLGQETIESERFSYVTVPTVRQRAPWERADDDTEFLVNIPFLHQIIEDQRTVLGAMRSHRVPLPEVPEGGDVLAAQRYADKLERGIAHMWRTWQMPVKLSELGYYATTFGTGVGVLRWDKTLKLPMGVVRSPENFIAQADPEDETRVQIGIFVRKTLGRMLIRQFPKEHLEKYHQPEEEYDLIDYYDDELRIQCIEEVDKFLVEVKNPLKKCPIYLFRSIAIPNSLFGASNTTIALPIRDELNRLYSKQAEYLDMVMNAPTFIKDPDEVPPNFTWNKDAVVTMGPQGAIGKAPIASIDARVFEYRLEDMKHNLDNAMDFSNLARGEYHQEVSGKGVVALKSGTQQRMMMRLQTFDPQIERMTEDALILWNKAGKKETSIYGKVDGSMFSDSFDPKVDIDPNWVHVYVYLDSAAYIDRQAAQVTNLQKLRGQPQAMSTRRFLELDPDCEDVEAEMQRIQQEQMEVIQMQQQAAMAMQPQPMEQAVSAEKGGPVEGAPMEGNVAPEEGVSQMGNMAQAGNPEAPPEAMAAEGEDVLPAVADMFRECPKVRGEVWLVGEALLNGLTPDEFADGFIDVYVSDPLDKATLLNYLRQTELAGAVGQQKLAFHEDEAFMLAHPRINVTPGTKGYAIEGTEEEIPEEELPMGMSPMDMTGGGMPPGGEMPPEGMPPEGMM